MQSFSGFLTIIQLLVNYELSLVYGHVSCSIVGVEEVLMSRFFLFISFQSFDPLTFDFILNFTWFCSHSLLQSFVIMALLLLFTPFIVFSFFDYLFMSSDNLSMTGYNWGSPLPSKLLPILLDS